MNEKSQFLKKYVDIKTPDDIWRLGTIVEGKNKEYVIVSLDGWSSNKNQVYHKYYFFILESLYSLK